MSGATRDAVLAVGLVSAFAALVTVHVATLFGLARRRHLAGTLGALIVPPLAPYLAFTRGMRARALAWLVIAAIYAAALVLAR
jgi:hypothetical protein